MPVQPIWPCLFFAGQKLSAETALHAARFTGYSSERLDRDFRQFQRAVGRTSGSADDSSHFAGDFGHDLDIASLEAAYQRAGTAASALLRLIQRAPCYPDPLLLWVLHHVLPQASSQQQRRRKLRRLGQLLQRQFPARLDLLPALIAAEQAHEWLKSLPEQLLPVEAFYSNNHHSLVHLQALWSKGRYDHLLRVYGHYQLHQRYFAGSDFVLRCYTMIGAIERVDLLFRAIYHRHNAELQPATLSNMIFTALGLDRLDQACVDQLVQHWRRLTTPQQPQSPAGLPPRSAPLRVHERPVLAVLSADLRMHPVGRFWLPMARAVAERFRLVHVGFNPHDSDPVREQLQACSAEWHLLETSASAEIDALLQQLQPDLLLDLGGHTADNRPGLLNQRFAPVQATYLGFYGPSYGEQCDWWILDAAIARRVRGSYPGSEPIWELNCPSLCYDPSSHGLPELEAIAYSEPDHPVIGSFNHTRKLTAACIARFGQILRAMPTAVLQFRSHSFFDPAVRRWFLQQFLDAGIAPHQLQPLPYAPSGKDALKDYGRIHLHLDSYPVSGTTTTLDALAMGIPVLTGPNHLYAGAISAAILEQAGLQHMVCDHPDQLPERAIALCERYRTATARRQLAAAVRRSPLCDTATTPRLFAEQLGEMLRVASLRQP